MKSPEEIKNEINLVDFAIINGYKINKEKSTNKWVHLSNDQDKIIVNTQKNMYFSMNNDLDKGDVIQFKANRRNGLISVDKSKQGIYETIKELNAYLGISLNDNDRAIIAEKDKFLEKKKQLHSLQDKQWNHEKIKDYSYLTDERKIDITVLKDKIFEDCLFNTYYKLPNDHIITNWAFGKYKDNKLVGLEVRNKNIKSIMGDHDGIFITKTNDIKKLDYLFYSESGIDALSYFEILKTNPNFDITKNNFAFISFGGNLHESKLNSVIDTIKHLPRHEQTKYISITDNDYQKIEEKREGKKYDVLMTTALLKENNFPLEYKENELFFIYSFPKENINEEQLNTLVDDQNKIVESKFEEKERYGKYLIVKNDKERVELHFPKKLNLQENGYIDFLKTIKKENLYIPHKPKGNKDWNEELKQKKNSNLKEKKNAKRIK